MKLIRKFFDTDMGSYGYASDEVKTSPFNFGLNAGVCKLVKFEWIPNGGKDGAEQEALDIVFNINGTDKNYRQFPVSKVYDPKTGAELTDTSTKEYKEARMQTFTDFSARMTHILHCFLDADVIKAKLQRPFANFKEYTTFLASMLPPNFKEVKLDIFLQYQWQPSVGQTRTYLDLPKKMSYGRWLCAAEPGTWTEHRAESIQESTKEALWYTNEKGEKHPFTRNGWFMLSNFAKLQSEGGTTDTNAANAMNASENVAQAPSSSTPSSPSAAASAW